MNAAEAIEYLQKKVDPAEPVFILRGQDKFAAETIRNWAISVQAVTGATKKITDALSHADQMVRWPVKKVPD